MRNIKPKDLRCFLPSCSSDLVAFQHQEKLNQRLLVSLVGHSQQCPVFLLFNCEVSVNLE